MISSASDYKFVTGDLNLIRIDGSIMPLRTGNTGKTYSNGTAIPRSAIMRGEDIAFLLEALGERRSVTQLYDPSVAQDYVNPSFVSTFSRKISFPQLDNLHSKLKSAFQINNFWIWGILQNRQAVVVDSGSTSDPGAGFPEPSTIYSNLYWFPSDWTWPAPSRLDSALQASYVQDLFNAINRMRRALVRTEYLDNSELEVTYHQTDTTDNPGPSQWTATKPRKFIAEWRNTVVSSGYVYYYAYGPGLIDAYTRTRPWCVSVNPHLCVFKVYPKIGSTNPTYKWVFLPVFLPRDARSMANSVLSALNLTIPNPADQRFNIQIELVGFYRSIELTNHTKFIWSQQ